jgi:hypothetical protein
MKKSQTMAIFFLFVFGFGGNVFAQKIKTTDGVKIISNKKNPTPPKGVPSKIRLEENFAIGSGNDPESSFASVSSLAVDDDGNIYALDYKDVKIKIFDRTGTFVRLFGQKGQGPGEMDTPASINLSPEGDIVIEDAVARQLAFFSKKGEFKKNLSLATQLGVVNMFMDRKGNFLAREMGFEGNKMYYEMKKFDREFNPVFIFDKIEFPIPLPGSGNKINIMDMMAIYQFDGEGNIFYGRNLDYSIKILSPEGKHIRTIQKDFQPEEVTEEDIANMLKGIPDVGVGNLEDMFEFAKHFPPYQFFTIDEEGRLYVKTWAKGKGENEYVFDVFDPEGVYIDRFESKLDIRLWKSDKMYAFEEDEEGYRLIKRFSVFWDKTS